MAKSLKGKVALVTGGSRGIVGSVLGDLALAKASGFRSLSS